MRKDTGPHGNSPLSPSSVFVLPLTGVYMLLLVFFLISPSYDVVVERAVFADEDGSHWGAPVQVSDGQGLSTHPAGTVDGEGNLHVVWSDNRNGNYEIYYREFSSDGRPVTGEMRLTRTLAMSVYPSISVSGDGAVHVAWLEVSASGIDLMYVTFLPGVSGDDAHLHPREVAEVSSGLFGFCEGYHFVPQQPGSGLVSGSPDTVERLAPVIMMVRDQPTIFFSAEENGVFSLKMATVLPERIVVSSLLGDSGSGDCEKWDIDSVSAVRDVSGNIFLAWVERGDHVYVCTGVYSSGLRSIVWKTRVSGPQAPGSDPSPLAVAYKDGVWGVFFEESMSREAVLRMGFYLFCIQGDGGSVRGNTEASGVFTLSPPGDSFYMARGVTGNKTGFWVMYTSPDPIKGGVRSFFLEYSQGGVLKQTSPESVSPGVSRRGFLLSSPSGDGVYALWEKVDASRSTNVYYSTREKRAAAEKSDDYYVGGRSPLPPAVFVPIPVLLSYYAYRVWQGARFGLLGVPGYSRLTREELLRNPTRKKILRLIENRPGINFSSLMREIGVKNGVLSYHLRVLERRGFVTSIKEGGMRRYYPARFHPPEEIETRIMRVLLQNPGMTQTDISKHVGVSRQVVNYHIKKLVNERRVKIKRDGRVTRCYPLYFLPE